MTAQACAVIVAFSLNFTIVFLEQALLALTYSAPTISCSFSHTTKRAVLKPLKVVADAEV